MVKNKVNRKGRLDAKRTLRAEEACPHCGKRQPDLDQHLKKYHAFSCDRCGKAFRTKGDWLNHMRDVHHQDERKVIQAQKLEKVDKWLVSQQAGQKHPQQRNGRRGGGRRACKEPTGRQGAKDEEPKVKSPFDPSLSPAQAAAAAAMENGDDDGADGVMEADSDDERQLPPPICESCGKQGPPEALILAKQGLSFRCVLLGLPCGTAPTFSQQQLAPGFFSAVRAAGGPLAGPSFSSTPAVATGPAVAGVAFGAAAVQNHAVNVPVGDEIDDDL